MGFDLSNYETVDSRIHKFWEMYINGRLETELIAYSDKQYIVKASVWKDMNDPHPSAVDYAEETIGTSMVNRTSALENCATSAIGRVLSDIGLSKIGNRASLTEMTKSERVEPKPAINVVDGPMGRAKATDKQIGFAKTLLSDMAGTLEFDKEQVIKWACDEYKATNLDDLSMKQISHLIADLQKIKRQGESSEIYNKIRAKKGADYDPWATPTN
jgi:hypothetical protein